MTTIFRLDSSIRAVGSQSRAVASTLEDSVREQLGELHVVRRDVGLSPLPATAWALATRASSKDPGERTVEEAQAAALATELADEMLAADAYIFSVPLYNYGVSQHAKAWIDLLITEPRFSVKVPSPISKRPAYLIIARGPDKVTGDSHRKCAVKPAACWTSPDVLVSNVRGTNGARRAFWPST